MNTNKKKLVNKKILNENFLSFKPIYKENPYNKPLIFKKKINKLVIKYPKHINSDTGQTKHFTPAAQEWHNNIYAYNTNYVKLLPSADTNLLNLLKSYFNIQLKNEHMNKGKHKLNRSRRLSAKKVFVGRGDLKHTSNKVIITCYIYNTEKKILDLKKQKLWRDLFWPNIVLNKYLNLDRKGNEIITYNRPFSLRELETWPGLYNLYYSYIIHFVNKLTLYLGVIIKYYEILTKLVEAKILTEDEKFTIFKNKVKNINTFKYPKFNWYVNWVLDWYKETYEKYKYLVYFNKVKSKKSFIWKLTRLVQNIYNKEVEFNIVNLKKMHLNSDIFTQAVSLKLRNRNNKLFKVLRSSLSKIKLPNVRRVTKDTKPNRDKYLINKIRNNRINSMFVYNIKKDYLNNLLLNFYPSANNLKIEIKKISRIVKRSISLENYVLKYLKHVKMAGIRVEAKGRLTRRFTASRSVFKMRWKGGLKNVDSSFRGLSAIILRGHVKSNVQYSVLNSKNRNGAFGIKGWIANK